MADNSLDALGPLMNEIGQALANMTDGNPEGVFLYVEIGPGWVSSSVFKDEEKLVRYLDNEEPALDDLLFEAWYLEPEDKRWSVMEYAIKDGKFEVSFKYSGEVEVGSFDPANRRAALRARYGDKPVVYPPPPQGAFELKP